MARETVPVGLLFSQSGSYALLGQAMFEGAMLGIAEVNADASLPFVLCPVAIDPEGRLASYEDGARRLLVEEGTAHVIGCYTSSSRKEVLPLFEKYDGMLWYPSHYEGFETSENVIYTGAAPNQHIVPLTRFLVDTGRRTAWLVGSNYVWAWENNRLMREALIAEDGPIMGERYFSVGETDLERIVEQVLDARPDFVFNTLIGESAYAFYQMFRAAAVRRGLDQPAACPVVSCSLAEPELRRLGPEAMDGHLCSSVYFSSVTNPENARFRAAWAGCTHAGGETSADAEASYIAVHLLARAVAFAGSARPDRVRAVLHQLELQAPQGAVRVDRETRHCYLRPRIGRSRRDGTFDIVWEAPASVRPDPYLVWHSLPEAAGSRGSGVVSRLRVVS